MMQFSGAQYLKMDVASKFGLDKENWDVRLAWFHENEHRLEELVPQADEQAGFLAGAMAYRKAKSGIATGYTISLDATSSGVQILAALSGCEKSARTCNLINTGNREDAYTIVYDSMNRELGANGYAMRDKVKTAVMTSLYGSKAEPRKVFGEKSKELTQFYKTMPVELPGAWELNEELINLWNPNAYKHSFTLADGFDVVLKVMDAVETTVHFNGAPYDIIQYVNQPKDGEVSLAANIVHSIDGMIVREMQRRCQYDRAQIESVLAITTYGTRTDRKKDQELLRLLRLYRDSQFMSARIFQYIDGENSGHFSHAERLEVKYLAQGMLVHRPFEILTIHDCFRCLPNYGNHLRYHYIEIMAQIARSEILSHIASQLTGRKVIAKKKADISSLILEAEYPIC